MGAILDWFKYDRLANYPALKVFDREAAEKRLAYCEREESAACEPWLTVARVLAAGCALVFLLVSYFHREISMYWVVACLPSWGLQYWMHLRIRRRVEAKVAAELRDGRVWTCYECGYDLRASAVRCPECGTAVRAGPR